MLLLLLLPLTFSHPVPPNDTTNGTLTAEDTWEGNFFDEQEQKGGRRRVRRRGGGGGGRRKSEEPSAPPSTLPPHSPAIIIAVFRLSGRLRPLQPTTGLGAGSGGDAVGRLDAEEPGDQSTLLPGLPSEGTLLSPQPQSPSTKRFRPALPEEKENRPAAGVAAATGALTRLYSSKKTLELEVLLDGGAAVLLEQPPLLFLWQFLLLPLLPLPLLLLLLLLLVLITPPSMLR